MEDDEYEDEDENMDNDNISVANTVAGNREEEQRDNVEIGGEFDDGMDCDKITDEVRVERATSH